MRVLRLRRMLLRRACDFGYRQGQRGGDGGCGSRDGGESADEAAAGSAAAAAASIAASFASAARVALGAPAAAVLLWSASRRSCAMRFGLGLRLAPAAGGLAPWPGGRRRRCAVPTPPPVCSRLLKEAQGRLEGRCLLPRWLSTGSASSAGSSTGGNKPAAVSLQVRQPQQRPGASAITLRLWGGSEASSSRTYSRWVPPVTRKTPASIPPGRCTACGPSAAMRAPRPSPARHCLERGPARRG